MKELVEMLDPSRELSLKKKQNKKFKFKNEQLSCDFAIKLEKEVK